MSNENKNTHIVTKPNQKPATPIDELKKSMTGELMTQVKNYYAGNKDEAMRFLTSAVEYVRRTPKLLQCDRSSLMMAFLQSAQFKFMPSGIAGEAYIIPYGRDAKFQLGYQGVVTLLYRTEKISTISAHIIYENDDFEYQEGLDTKLVHKPAMFGKKKGKAIGVYAVAQMRDGQKTFKVMDEEAVMAIKNLSKAKNVKESPWNSDKDPELWMWKKTCLLQLAKLLPKTQDLQKAVDEDYKGEGLDKPEFDAGGPAVGGSFHNPADFDGAEEANTNEKTDGQKQDDEIPVIEEDNYPGPKPSDNQ